jgi:hypothetical protein
VAKPKFALTAAALALLAGCAAYTAAKTGQPLNQAQVQADLANANYLMQAAGCLTAQAGAVAAPIVAIAGDAEGSQVLTAVDGAGAIICKVTVPPTALPIPAPANAPAVAAAP